MVIETQASRISEQEALISELRDTITELRSLKANLEETISEFRRQLFGSEAKKHMPQNSRMGRKRKKSLFL